MQPHQAGPHERDHEERGRAPPARRAGAPPTGSATATARSRCRGPRRTAGRTRRHGPPSVGLGGRTLLPPPGGEPAGAADRPQPPLGLRPRPAGGDQQRLVTPHQPGGLVGDERRGRPARSAPPRRPRAAAAPAGRRRAAGSPAGTVICIRSASSSSSGADSTSTSRGVTGVAIRSRRATQGSDQPWTTVKTTTSTKTVSKMNVRPGHLRGQREGRQHDRDGAAQSRPGDERLLRPRHAEPHEAGEHRQRPGHQQQRPADRPARARARRAAGRGRPADPSSTNSPIWASEAMPSANPMLAGAVRQRRRCPAPARTGRPRRSPTCAPATPSAKASTHRARVASG